MAIVIGIPTEETSANFAVSSYTFTHVSGTGTDRFLEVAVCHRLAAAETITGITFDGVSATQIGQLNDGDGDTNLAVFGLIAPTSSGSPLDVVVTLSGVGDDEFASVAITCTDVHQTVPYDVGDVRTDSEIAANHIDPTLTIPTATGEVVFDAVGSRTSRVYTVGADQIDEANIVQGFTKLIVSSQAGADGGVMDGSWTTLIPAWAHIGFALKPTAAAGVTVVVPTGALIHTGQVPVIAIPVTVQVPVGSLVHSGKVPVIATPVSITVPTGSLVHSGKVPVIATPITINVPTGSLVYAGQVPVVALAVTIVVPTGSLTYTGQAPVVVIGTGTVVVPPTAALVHAGQVPTVLVPLTIPVPTGALVHTGQVPVVKVPVTVVVPTGSLVHTGRSPIVSVPVTIVVPAGLLSHSGQVPVIAAPVIVVVPTGSLVYTGQAPVVTVGALIFNTVLTDAYFTVKKNHIIKFGKNNKEIRYFAVKVNKEVKF